MSNEVLPVFAFDRLRMGTDGQGVRTLIGLYGCPLKCKYCINPQSRMANTAIMRMTPEVLLKQVIIDDLYFRATGGGITFGGGEPLLYMKGIERFVYLCPDEWNIWVETSLYVSHSTIERAADVFDHFVVDIKSTDLAIFSSYTRGDGAKVLENLKWLLGKVGRERLTVRVPVIPGFSTLKDQRESSAFLRELGITNLDEFTYETNCNGYSLRR